MALSAEIRINLFKTIRFNFHYFPARVAWKLPVLVYRGTVFHKLKGNVKLNVPAKFGMIKIGKHRLGIFDRKYERTLWDVSGTVEFNGKTKLDSGSRISVGKNGRLALGKNFILTGGSAIVAHHDISFGNDCLLSWEILVMDTDHHKVLDTNGKVMNAPKPIAIGNHVWIGCRNTILKGVSIADNTIIAAGSLITSSHSEPGCVIGGQGAIKVIKRGINWAE